MPITLNNYNFDPNHTAVREEHRELAGQDGRTIVISGVVPGLSSVVSIESALDSVLAAASDTEDALLSLRAGRVMRVRRQKFTREIQQAALVGRYELTLHAENAFEESATPTILPWTITTSGATRTLTQPGNAPTPALLVLQANGNLTTPSLSDGTRTITFGGVLPAGMVIEFDGVQRQARLEGADITPYVTGEFPFLLPGSNTLTYNDAPASSHLAQVAIWFYARWW